MKREKRKPLRVRIATLILFVLLLHASQFTVSPIHAAEATSSAKINDIGYSRIHPASPFYFLKTIREDLELRFAGTDRVKMLRRLEFSTRRLREARTLLTINQNLIQPTLERYIVHLNSLPDKDQVDEEFGSITQNNLAVHLKVLQQIYDQSSNLKAKMALRSAMNRIIQRADTPNYAKLSVCNFFAKEASISSLNQTEQIVLAERAKKCQKINK